MGRCPDGEGTLLEKLLFVDYKHANNFPKAQLYKIQIILNDTECRYLEPKWAPVLVGKGIVFLQAVPFCRENTLCRYKKGGPAPHEISTGIHLIYHLDDFDNWQICMQQIAALLGQRACLIVTAVRENFMCHGRGWATLFVGTKWNAGPIKQGCFPKSAAICCMQVCQLSKSTFKRC